jgi:hypothetical protein
MLRFISKSHVGAWKEALVACRRRVFVATSSRKPKDVHSAIGQFCAHRARKCGFLLATTGPFSVAKASSSLATATTKPKSALFSTRWYRSNLDVATDWR